MFYMSHQVIRNFFHFLFICVSIFLLSGCPSTPKDLKPEAPLVYPSPPEEPRFYYERTLRTSFDIKEVTATDRLKWAVTGQTGSGFGLGKPYGVAVFQGRVYVTDTIQRAVLMFDAPNREVKLIGAEGPGALSKPIGIAISKTGDLFVVDNSARHVVVYDKDGNYLRGIGSPEYFNRPSGVAVSPDGSKLYVVDTGGVDDSEHHQFTIWDVRTGAFIKAVGKRGAEPGEFNLPLQVATAPNGTVYVVDGGNFRVQAFSADGQYLKKFGMIGIRTGQFSRPKGVATDNDGNVYVIDTAFGNFQIFNSDGQLLLFVGTRGESGKPGEYMLPAGIAVDEDGRVYMVDQFFKKVDVYRPAKLQPNEGWLSMKIKAKKK